MDNSQSWQNRIVGYKLVPANQLLANPDNAHRHPARQREALRGSLDELGIVDVMHVNIQTGYLIDGHARVEEALSKDENMLLPVIEVDINEDEEALFLASFDHIGTLGTWDKEVLDTLMQRVKSPDSRTQAMLSEMAIREGVIPPINPADEWQGMPEFEQEAINAFHSIKVVFDSIEDVSAFSELVKQTVTDETTIIHFPPIKAEPFTHSKSVVDES